jgi:Na+-driven multidrug efflux pump
MRGFVCIIGCSLLFAAAFGINGVWLSFPASELLTAIVMAVVLVRDNRRL